MRTAVDWRTSEKKNYIAFCKENPNIDLEYEDWKAIIYRYMEIFRSEMLETGEKRKLPAGIGEFVINKRKRKRFKTLPNNKQVINLPIDWKKTREKGKYVYNFNYDTEEYYFGWVWFRRAAWFKNRELWYFKPARASSRLIAHYVKKDKKYQYKYCDWGK